MISFTLKCESDHQFESWFQSGEAFDKLQKAGLVTCAVCGSSQVAKAIMAPSVRPSGDKAAKTAPLSQPASPAEQAIREMRAHVEKNATYVGNEFATEARAMHEGTMPERSIYGEARAEDAKKLIDDGIPVAPLPFGPSRKSN